MRGATTHSTAMSVMGKEASLDGLGKQQYLLIGKEGIEYWGCQGVGGGSRHMTSY